MRSAHGVGWRSSLKRGMRRGGVGGDAISEPVAVPLCCAAVCLRSSVKRARAVSHPPFQWRCAHGAHPLVASPLRCPVALPRVIMPSFTRPSDLLRSP